MKIGFFDSGLGGLTILASVRKLLPYYDYVFYGDTAHVPYGDRTEEEVYILTQKAIEFLLNKDCALVVVACNTASAETLRKLQDTILREKYPDRVILGVIIPTIEAIIDAGVSRVLLIGTRRTIESRKYERELAKRGRTDIEIVGVATPTLVPHIESGCIDDAFSDFQKIFDGYSGSVDTLVLGCTHYTLLKMKIRDTYGRGLRVISQDEIIPKKLTDYLVRHSEIEIELTQNSTEKIYLTKRS